jgi:hypothetical protein
MGYLAMMETTISGGTGKVIPAIVSATLLVVGAVAFALYGSGGSRLFETSRSPKGDEQIDFYSATRWQAMRNPNADLQGYVRLRRVADGAVLGTSDAFELSGESLVIWRADRIQIGTSAVYDRASGKWTLLR